MMGSRFRTEVDIHWKPHSETKSFVTAESPNALQDFLQEEHEWPGRTASILAAQSVCGRGAYGTAEFSRRGIGSASR